MVFGPRGPRRRPGDKPSRPERVDDVEATVISAPGGGARPAAPRSKGVGDGPPAEPSGPRLVDLASDWFSTILALRSVPSLPDAEALRARFLAGKQQIESSAAQAGISPTDLDDALLALVALVDETILGHRGPARDAWLDRPLSQVVFRHMLGGEQFFKRLEVIRREPLNRIQALEVYACCLALGFKGRMRTDSAGLSQLEQQVFGELKNLRRGGPPPLAPNAAWKPDAPPTGPRPLSWWKPPVGAVVGLLATVFVAWLVSLFLASGIESEINRWLAR